MLLKRKYNKIIDTLLALSKTSLHHSLMLQDRFTSGTPSWTENVNKIVDLINEHKEDLLKYKKANFKITFAQICANLSFHALINENFYLVDVPGYGFAKVSKVLKNKFGLIIEDYLKERDNLKMVFMLIDFRHKPTNDDVLMYNYLKYYNIPVTIVATKSDKVSRNNYDKNKKIIKDTLSLIDSDDLVLFSAVDKEGKKDVHDKILSVVEE